MIAVFKREFKSYFSTPVGYIMLTVFYFFLGLFFRMIFQAGATEVNSVVMAMSTIAIFVIPVLTMRLMSEDRRQKVDQVLLTAPVKLIAIVMGKFLAALAVFAIGFAPTVIFEIIVAGYISVNVMYYVYALFGMMLLGGALIAIGMFISSLTESAVVSAIITIVINFFVLYMSSLAQMITVPSNAEGFFEKLWAKILEIVVLILNKCAFLNVAENFGENIFSISDIVYFLSIIALFIFLSVRSLDKRRWS